MIDPETGEARNASTGETMEMPNASLPSPRSTPSTPISVPIEELQQLAGEADIKVSRAMLGV